MKFFRKYRQLTLPLVVLLLLTATGLTIDKHSCQGELRGISILGQAASCHQMAMSCHHQKAVIDDCANAISDKGCCHNETQLVKLDSDLVELVLETSLAPNIDVSFLAIFEGLVYPSSTQLFLSFKNYKPPLLNKNILVFVQSFLL